MISLGTLAVLAAAGVVDRVVPGDAQGGAE